MEEWEGLLENSRLSKNKWWGKVRLSSETEVGNQTHILAIVIKITALQGGI